MKYKVLDVVKSTSFMKPDGSEVPGKVVDLEDETGKSRADITIWGSKPISAGMVLEGEIVPSGRGYKLQLARTGRAGISQEDREKMDMYRGYGAAYGACTNQAVQMLSIKQHLMGDKEWSDAEAEKFILAWRDRFLQHSADFDKKIRAKLGVGKQ